MHSSACNVELANPSQERNHNTKVCMEQAETLKTACFMQSKAQLDSSKLRVRKAERRQLDQLSEASFSPAPNSEVMSELREPDVPSSGVG